MKVGDALFKLMNEIGLSISAARLYTLIMFCKWW